MLIVEKSLGKTQKHEITKNLILDKLKDLNIKYKLIKDLDITGEDFCKYNLFMSLGGDGTFLKLAKKLTHQSIIGVNSDLENSVGFLTDFNSKNIFNLLNNLKSKNYKIKKINRISTFINDKQLNSLAINEVFIGNLDIRKTSHLDIQIGNRESFVRGNGIIVSTKQGSNAFYKSAGGESFLTNSIGYTCVLPYSIDGNLEKNEIFDLSARIKLFPKRSSNTISFDSDDRYDYLLEKGDKIEIIIDKNNNLNCITI